MYWYVLSMYWCILRMYLAYIFMYVYILSMYTYILSMYYEYTFIYLYIISMHRNQTSLYLIASAPPRSWTGETSLDLVDSWNLQSPKQVLEATAFLCLHAIHKPADCFFHGGCI